MCQLALSDVRGTVEGDRKQSRGECMGHHGEPLKGGVCLPDGTSGLTPWLYFEEGVPADRPTLGDAVFPLGCGSFGGGG